MSSLDFFRNLQPLFESKMSELDLEKKEAALKKSKDTKAKKTDEKKASNVKETAGAFFRRYSDIITEAEAAPELSEKEAADRINQVIMQAVNQSASKPQVKESALNEGILQKIMPIVAAAGIGLGAIGAATDASAQQNGQEWQSREQVTTQSGQTAERECINRAQQVADLVNQYGHVLQSHTEIIKQCGPYIITGQRIEVRDNNVANILIGVLGVAAVLQQQNNQRDQHGGYNQRNQGNQGSYSQGNYKGNQGPGGNRDAGGFYPYGGYRQ